MAEFISAFTLPGTQITDINNDWRELSARTHRQSKFAENPVELWYERAGGWTLFPVQPVTGPTQGLNLTQTYKQPSTLGFTLPDPQGLYAPEDHNSAYNYDTSDNWDPLLDEARKIVCRVGTKCYKNLAALRTPTTDCAATSGSMSLLTDLITGDIASSSALYMKFEATPYSITVDLGSVQHVRHAVIRFGTKCGVYPYYLGTCYLPANVTISLSPDGNTWTDYPPRFVGDTGRGVISTGTADAFTCGDWADSPSGQTIELAFCDLEAWARYVSFTPAVPHVPSNLLFGDPWFYHFVDELAVYGGDQFDVLGANVFTGYLGDQIDFTPSGEIKCVAVDVLKKLADNNDNFITAAYRMTSTGAIELGDIVHSLLTSTAYWRGESDYDTAFTDDEIGWGSGNSLTGLQYPLWQGQSNSMLGYCLELFGAIGWHFYADGNGVLQAVEPPYRQYMPDRVCIAAGDGNYDVWDCERHRTGKQMRNKVIVQTGKGPGAVGSGTIKDYDFPSIARYGTRTTRITDPLATTTDLRQKVARHFLRDYAWNLQTLTNTVRPQFETKLKQVFGFRAPARPNLFALGTQPEWVRGTYLDGKLRDQELWSLVGLSHNITYGQWTAQAEWIPYRALGPEAPTVTTLNQFMGHSDSLILSYETFTAVVSPEVTQYFRVYVSTTSAIKGYSLYQDQIGIFAGGGSASLTITGLTPGLPVWAYMTSIDVYGNESEPSSTLSAIPGSTSEAITDYTITDFTVGSTLSQGPDAAGYYTYQFLGLWTAPAAGFTQDDVRASVGSLPADPTDRKQWRIHNDSFNWWGPDRILQGLTWDNSTPGQLDFVFTFRTKSNLSGLTMYWRIWNSSRTRAWRPVQGNYTSCVVI